MNSDVINKLSEYAEKQTKVKLQVKDLDPSTNARHFSESMGGEGDQYITGVLRIYPTYVVFIQDGQEYGRVVLNTSYDKISEVKNVKNSGRRRKYKSRNSASRKRRYSRRK